jgi:hypothetical protein
MRITAVADALSPLRPARRTGYPGIARRQAADRGPIKVVAVAREQGQEAITQEARERHRDAQIIGRGEHESDVLVSEGGGEPRRLKLSFRNQLAVDLVDGSSKKGCSQHLDIVVAIDAMFAHERDGFAERFNGGGNEEISAELDEARVSNSGVTSAIVSRVPAAITASCPAAATSGRPNTGAAMKR